MSIPEGEFHQSPNDLKSVTIVSAEAISRPALPKREDQPLVHHGVRVKGSDGHFYLLHYTHGGVIATQTISSSWKKDHDLPVKVVIPIEKLLFDLSIDTREYRFECAECSRCVKTNNRIAEYLAE